MKRYDACLLIGAPGSGKGTQGKALGALPQFFHCACGDVFRSIDTNTPLGQIFREYSSRGQLVPDNVTVELWRSRIAVQVHDGRFNPETACLVLDGIPRNINQARLMEEYVNLKKVVHLKCSQRDVVLERLKRRALKEKRFDDASESVIRHRIEIYDRESKLLLEYYSNRILEIDANQSVAKVLQSVLSGITAETGG